MSCAREALSALLGTDDTHQQGSVAGCHGYAYLVNVSPTAQGPEWRTARQGLSKFQVLDVSLDGTPWVPVPCTVSWLPRLDGLPLPRPFSLPLQAQ